jgi:hypothetical protein
MEPADDAEFKALNEQADKGELTPEVLQAKLNQYHEAFRQEFEDSLKSADANVQAYTTDFFQKNVHHSAAQIAWLAINAESESVRLAASKYVVEMATKQSAEQTANDPIKELLESLTKKKAQPQPTPDNP